MASGSIPKYADGNDSGWQDLTLSNEMSSTGHVYYRKIGNVVYVHIRGVKFTSAITDTDPHTIGVLPEGYRPKISNVDGFAGYDGLEPGMITIRTSGLVRWTKPTSINSYNATTYGSIVFLTD